MQVLRVLKNFSDPKPNLSDINQNITNLNLKKDIVPKLCYFL